MGTKLQHPATFCVAGPTGCGKTQWVGKLIRNHQVFVEPLERILWCYGQHQPAYEELSRDLPDVQFVEGLPEDWSEHIDPTHRNLVVLDDLMQECGKDPQITKLFTQGSHHRKLSVIYIVQMYPGRTKFMVEAYADATSLPHSYLFIDLKPHCPEEHRLRSCIFPGETSYAYVPK